MTLLRGYHIKNNLHWQGFDFFDWNDFYNDSLSLYNNDQSALERDLLFLINSPIGLKNALYNKYLNNKTNHAFVRQFTFSYQLKNFLENKDIKWYRQLFIHVNIAMFGTLEYITVRKILIKKNFVLHRNTIITDNDVAFGDNFNFFAAPKVGLNTSFYYLTVFYRALKNLILPLIVSVLLGVLLLNYFSVNFLKNLAAWLVVGLIFFWLMSGFNFFIKRYRFGKYTSAIQRFWKRTNAYFWLIEGFLFLLFFYYYLNSSQEVYYFFDEANLNQPQLLSLTSFYFSNILLLLLIFYSIFIILNLSSYNFKQLLTHLTVVTLGIIFIFLLECYQFYYIITMFYESVWSYSGENAVWGLTIDSPKIRAKQQYFILALIAKYWHFLFIFFSWLFVVFKSYEQRRIHYTLFGVNLQNLMLLLLLNSLFAANWLKWVIRRFYDISYYWFFADINNWTTSVTAEELLTFFQFVNVAM
jgi:hypothetical protein